MATVIGWGLAVGCLLIFLLYAIVMGANHSSERIVVQCPTSVWFVSRERVFGLLASRPA